jgi:uncharacterized protein YceK
MKKIIIVAITLLALTSCTSIQVHTQALQQDYDIVYIIENNRYICIDSSKKVYDIILSNNGEVLSKVEIR